MKKHTLNEQELKMCKKIGYEYYCKELFVVKSKTRYSCAVLLTLIWNQTS